MPDNAPAKPNDALSEDLIARAQRGDRSALEALLAQHAPAIYRFGLRMCRDPEDARDILQDTLLQMATHIGEFAGRSSLSSWLFALARSACARRRRGLKNQPMAPEDRAPDREDLSPGPELAAERQELAVLMEQALHGLPEAYREVLLLRDVEGLSAPEAAASLGISVEATKSRLHRAREALRQALRPVLEERAPPRGAACPDIADAWSRKLEDELSQSDCAAMEEHLRTCPSCSAVCDALRRSLRVCRSIGAEDGPVPPAVQEQVKVALRAFTAAQERGAQGDVRLR